MKQDENSSSNNSEKIISATELRQLLTNPPKEIIESSGEESTIVIDGYTIEDEYIILDESIIINLRLKFNNCTFQCDKSLWIDGLVCNEFVTFEGCSLPGGIYFRECLFKKKLLFKYVRIKDYHFSGGTFEKISISGYDAKKIWISGAKFESLLIGEYLVNDNIQELTIFAKPDEVGNITVTQQNIDKLYLSGSNKDRKFSFAKIKCNTVAITDFTNEGSLNFYGIEPKDLTNDKRYFQIINSNMEKAQFYRAFFSHYKELIIIDSFITESLFIGCKWINNIRALYGPGYGTFEESVKAGRKTTPAEVVAIREAYRQLKISMAKHSDKIQENKFYAEELNFHNKTLAWGKPSKNQFWDKIILYLSKSLSDNGQSFIKPVFWLLAGHLIFFTIALLLNAFSPLHISFSNPTESGFQIAFQKYFFYMNPLRRVETSLTGYFILIDFFMRIWSSYMLYNIIRATRRFIS
ncbi:MAG: hypothetical protein ABIR30_00575 [Chitinophagaceae bacterium]